MTFLMHTYAVSRGILTCQRVWMGKRWTQLHGIELVGTTDHRTRTL